MHKKLFVIGIILQVIAVLGAYAMADNGSGSTTWNCSEGVDEGPFMRCMMDKTPMFSATAWPAVPITVGLLGLGLIIASVGVGQNRRTGTVGAAAPGTAAADQPAFAAHGQYQQPPVHPATAAQQPHTFSPDHQERPPQPPQAAPPDHQAYPPQQPPPGHQPGG